MTQLQGAPVDALQSWASVLAAEPTGLAADGRDAHGGNDSARLLALMRQEMSTFGATSGEADLNWRKADQLRPMDFFAG